MSKVAKVAAGVVVLVAVGLAVLKVRAVADEIDMEEIEVDDAHD